MEKQNKIKNTRLFVRPIEPIWGLSGSPDSLRPKILFFSGVIHRIPKGALRDSSLNSLWPPIIQGEHDSGAQNTATNLIVFCDFLVFQCICWVLYSLKWSKIANLGLRMDCHIFLDIYGTIKFRPNIDPQTPYLLQKYFQKYKNAWKHFSKILFV